MLLLPTAVALAFLAAAAVTVAGCRWVGRARTEFGGAVRAAAIASLVPAAAGAAFLGFLCLCAD